jgi:hypothetical protein
MTIKAQSITTAGLVAAAVALGAWLMLVERSCPTTAETQARKHNLLKAFRHDELTEISIESSPVPFRLARKADPGDSADPVYYLGVGSGPADDPADPIAVDHLIHALEFATAVRDVNSDIPRAKMGLDSPRARIRLSMGSLRYALAVGNDANSPAGSAYVELEGAGTFVLSRDFVLDVLKPLDAYRSKHFVAYSPADLSAIELGGAGGTRRLVRAPWGGFRLTEPSPGPRVHRIVFEQLLNGLAALRAERFIADAAAERALAAASERVSIVLEPVDSSRSKVLLEVGGECPGAERSPLADDARRAPKQGSEQGLVVAVRKQPGRMSGCVPAAELTALKLSIDAYADKHLLALRADEVEELTLRQADRTLELLRKGTGWLLRNPEQRDVSAEDAKGWIDGLLAIEGEIIQAPDLKALGLDPAKGLVLVRQPASGEQDHPEQRIDVGEIKSDQVAVRRHQDGVVLRLSAAQGRLLQPSTTFLRPTTLLDVAPELVRRVSVGFAEAERQVITRGPSGFRLEMPPGFVADGALSADLFELLAKLQAERWESDHDDGSFGLGHPRVTVGFEVSEDGATRTHEVVFGDRTPQGSYAKWDADPAVFVLPRSAENALTTYAIDRSVFMIDPSEVRSVQLQVEAHRALLVAKPGEKWVCAPDSPSELPATAIARVQEALVEMRTEGVVHLGDPVAQEGFSKPLATLLVQRVPGRAERSGAIRLSFGRGDAWRGMNVHYARREGYNATFAIAAAKLKPILEAFEGR